jgi:serine/threonine protein kinase
MDAFQLALYKLKKRLSRAAEPARPALYLAQSKDGQQAQIDYPPVIGSWKVLGTVASGTSATVYRVVPTWAPNATEHYALKLHSDRHAGEADARSRFRREIRILKSFKHRNVVGMVEAGEYQGRLFIVMELVEGFNLRQALETRKPHMTGKLDWCIQIARGLAATHRRGIVHRDLKPENILTTRVGVIKLADFGLARHEELQKVTRVGYLVGTPAYMAPESLMGCEPDRRSDLYSLGVILYEIFTGKMPYDASSVTEFIDAHLNQAPVPPRRHVPSMPPELESLILRLLEKNPKDRVQSADELREALEAVLAQVVGVADIRTSARVVA